MRSVLVWISRLALAVFALLAVVSILVPGAIPATIMAGLAMASIIGPVPEGWTGYLASLPGALEIIPDVLYDTQTFVSASTQQLVFFTTPQSAGRSDITNMESAGQLPSPQSFLIQSPQLFFKTTPQSDDSGAGDAAALVSTMTDIVNIIRKGVATLFINSKSYGPFPLWKWPVGSMVQGPFGTGSDLLADYGQNLGNFVYPFDPMLCLLPMQPFKVVLQWPAGTITTSGGASIDIQVLFDGQRARSIG